MPSPRLFRPDVDAPRPLPAAEPLPLQMRSQVHETPLGAVTDFFITWRIQAGNRCRFCPDHECTFVLATDDIGTCVIRREGARSSPFAAIS